MENYHLSKREKEVLELLLQGLSNKQIAARLRISVHTVEFHLNHIYKKLGVGSRSETFVKLGKTLVSESDEKPGESAVDRAEKTGDNGSAAGGSGLPPSQNEFKNNDGQNQGWHWAGWFFNKYIILGLIGFLLVIGLILLIPRETEFERYEQECEYPDEASVGQTMERSNASNGKVHGQFGTLGEAPWDAKAGYVIYQDIHIPQTLSLFLRLRYSKNSLASTLILVYLDNEAAPRASILLKDQGDWERFEWTDPIYLGKVKRGVHALKLYTQGQQYGTADLDQFVLTSEIP